MPTALVFALRPARRAMVAASLGGAAHAAMLEQIAAIDPALAAQTHGDQWARPLTVSPILGLEPEGPRATVTPERVYHLRVTLLSPELEALAAHWAPDGLRQLSLGGVLWQVEGTATAPAQHPGADRASYEQLLAAAIGGAEGPQDARWRLSFVTPMMFRQRSRCLPLPTPELVFGSLLERWNALAPQPLSEEVRRFAGESLVVNDFDLRSAGLRGKGDVPQVGAVGTCSYTATERDLYLETCLSVLARFAYYSGVGAGTARGFGQTRLLPGARAARRPTDQRAHAHA